MGVFRQHKTLYIFVSAVLVVSLIVYCFGFYSVQAAEVSMLPADIDITVSYDADNVNWSYSGTDYTFSRSYAYSYDYDGVTYYPRSSYPSSMQPPFNLYYIDCTYPAFTVESDRQNRLMGVSYWFSPSENALYILESVVPSDDSSYLSVRGFAKKDGYGCIVFDKWSSSKTYYNVCYRYDFISSSCTLGWVSTGSSNDSRFRTSYNYYDLSSGFTYYGKYNSQSDAYWVNSRNTTLTAYFPADLLCLYSNYPISGFYEPDISKVETPDYYMTYQYIFYRKDKGYTFIDSARPLTEITAQGSYAYLTFAEVCNKYIYTSADGTAWTLQTDAASMYGNSFTALNYSWFYDDVTVGAVNQYDAELVYTNDDKFGDRPLVTPDWGDLTDITDNLHSIVNDKPLSGRLLGALANDISLSNFFDLLAYGIVGDGFDFWINETDPTDHGHFGPRGSADTSASYVVTYPSLATYLYNLVLSSQNLDITLSAFREDSYSALKSIFDNITITNAYLSAISDKLDKLNIPDYTASLKDISSKLDKLPSGSSVFTPFDDTAILGRFDIANDYLKDIKGLETGNLLTNILNLLTGTDGEGMKVTINPNFKLDLDNNLKASFSAKIDKIFDKLFDIDATLDKIAEFNFGTGGADKDYSSVLTLINDNLYTASGRIYDLNQPLEDILQAINNIDLTVSFPESEPKNDLFYDNPDSDEDLIDFVSEYAKTALDKSYFASYLTFDNDTMSAIRFYNGLSEDTFEALGPLGAALLVSVGFTLVGAAVRRHI